MPPITYQQSGVDPEKAARILSDFAGYLQKRPRDPALLAGIGPFAACYSLKEALGQYSDPVLVTGCDGVGTKAKLASDWNSFESLGQDLVAMNVNDLLCAGATPALFLDYYACGALEEKHLAPLLRSIQAACELSGCSLAGGETAEMPGVYRDGDFDLAGFAIGFAERRWLLGAARVQPGDQIVALASSGVHSNGFSLVRKLVEHKSIQPDETTPFERATWRQVLLRPTTIYVPLLKSWSPQWAEKIHAAAHLTGGGLFENLPRVLPKGTRAKITAWDFPPLFQWLKQAAELPIEGMLSTFNCGVGMLVICPGTEADSLVAHSRDHGVAAWKTGIVEKTETLTAPEIVWE